MRCEIGVLEYWSNGILMLDIGCLMRDAGQILDDLIPMSRLEGGVLIGDTGYEIVVLEYWSVGVLGFILE